MLVYGFLAAFFVLANVFGKGVVDSNDFFGLDFQVFEFSFENRWETVRMISLSGNTKPLLLFYFSFPAGSCIRYVIGFGLMYSHKMTHVSENTCLAKWDDWSGWIIYAAMTRFWSGVCMICEKNSLQKTNIFFRLSDSSLYFLDFLNLMCYQK